MQPGALVQTRGSRNPAAEDGKHETRLLMLACFQCFFNPQEVRGEGKLYRLFLLGLAVVSTFRRKIPCAKSGRLPGVTVAAPGSEEPLPPPRPLSALDLGLWRVCCSSFSPQVRAIGVLHVTSRKSPVGRATSVPASHHPAPTACSGPVCSHAPRL